MIWLSERINESTHPGLDAEIGRYTYGNPRILYKPEENHALRIGSFCSIAENVKIFLGTFGRHQTHLASTYPMGMVFNTEGIDLTRRDHNVDYSVEIGSDVWIGRDVTVFSGVKIGHGVVVGTGSLVSKDIPPYAIVGGIPARIISYRFSENIIEELLDLEWWNLSDELIQECIASFYQDDISSFLAIVRANSQLK